MTKSSSSNSPFNQDSLREYLVEACGCKYEGKPMPPPYVSEDDMQEGYTKPDGSYFSIPDPNNPDGTYSDFTVAKILEINKLTPKVYDVLAVKANTEN